MLRWGWGLERNARRAVLSLKPNFENTYSEKQMTIDSIVCRLFDSIDRDLLLLTSFALPFLERVWIRGALMPRGCVAGLRIRARWAAGPL